MRLRHMGEHVPLERLTNNADGPTSSSSARPVMSTPSSVDLESALSPYEDARAVLVDRPNPVSGAGGTSPAVRRHRNQPPDRPCVRSWTRKP